MVVAFLLLAASTPVNSVGGSWDLRAGQVTIFRFVVESHGSNAAMWIRPKHFESDGQSYSHISGGVVREGARTVRRPDGDLNLEFSSSGSGLPPMSIRFHRVDPEHMEATIEGTGMEPLQLVRALNATPVGPWDPTVTYVPTVTRTTNAEMTAIFNADQADRQSSHIDWTKVGPADRKRRERTEELLDSGALQSGDDYYHAAFVFQHGSTTNDFLKAHVLAMVAMARGKSAASWIAAATLDRYLQTTGLPQVLGTQFQMPKGAPVTQEPYDRTLISDATREALHVPTQAAQEAQRKEFEAPLRK